MCFQIIVEETKLFKVTVSFGSVTSLISLPCYMSHASIPADVRAARGLPDDLVRISCGIEHINDLVADLDQAMTKAMAKIGVPLASPTTAVVGAGVAHSASGNHDYLLDRVRQLEAQVQLLVSREAAGLSNGKR